MIVLFWNCRGLAQASTISSLRAMLRQYNPDCLCIVETKISNASGILALLGYVDSVEVPAVGLRGGSIFAWRRGLDFNLVIRQEHMISIILFGEPTSLPWTLTFIHNPCDPQRKNIFWDEDAAVG